MVCLPYISCNGTCFVHEIFRLDAIERYIVTFYHIVAKNWFPKVNFHSLYRGFVLPHYCVYLSPEGVLLSPEGDVLNPEGFVLPHFWDYLPPEGVVVLPEGN